MERAQECSDALQHMYAVDDRDGYAEFAQEISKAVSMLSSVEWEDIRKEKFFLTPRALYDELARTADSLNSRMAAETTRRQQWLGAAEVPGEDRQIPVVRQHGRQMRHRSGGVQDEDRSKAERGGRRH